jgi:hypothetical protein
MMQHHQQHQHHQQRQHQAPALGNSGNGMSFPASQVPYHASAGQYAYHGYGGDPNIAYTPYAPQVNYDQSDQQAAIQRAQLAYYQQQFYGYPGYAQATGAHLGSAGTAQLSATQAGQQIDHPAQAPDHLGLQSNQHAQSPYQQYREMAAQPAQVARAAQMMQHLHIQTGPRQDQQYGQADFLQFGQNGYQYTSGSGSGQDVSDARSSESASEGASVAAQNALEHDGLPRFESSSPSSGKPIQSIHGSGGARTISAEASRDQQGSHPLQSASQREHMSGPDGREVSSQRSAQGRQDQPQRHHVHQGLPSQHQSQRRPLQAQQRMASHPASSSRTHLPSVDSGTDIRESQATQKALRTV